MQTALFLLVIFLANVIQYITGFAGTVLAMPFSILLVGYDTAEPIINILSIVNAIYIIITLHKSINKKELLKMASVMLIGMALGMFFKDSYNGNPSLLYKILGVIVIIFALMNAYSFYFGKEKENKSNRIMDAAILVASGAIHGIFICGGPLLVTYANKKLKDKDEFRSTMFSIWMITNSIVMIDDIRLERLTVESIPLLLISIAVLILAMIVGSLIYKKMSKKAFLNLTYILMIISGISLFIK